jgi:hypothetical protein
MDKNHPDSVGFYKNGQEIWLGYKTIVLEARNKAPVGDTMALVCSSQLVDKRIWDKSNHGSPTRRWSGSSGVRIRAVWSVIEQAASRALVGKILGLSAPGHVFVLGIATRWLA